MAGRPMQLPGRPQYANLGSVNVLELSGIEHMRLGELAEAERDLSEALQRRAERHPDEPNHPGMVTAINNLAVLHLKQRRFEEAAEEFERVVEINEQQQRRTPSSRLALEIEAAKRNLATVHRLASQEARQPAIAPSSLEVARTPGPIWTDPMLLPASDAAAVASAADAASAATVATAAAGWAAVRAAAGSDVLKTTNRKHKEQIAKKLGIDPSGLAEADVDAAIRRKVAGGNLAGGNVDGEALRISISMAFEALDEDGDGAVSRAELLKGLKSKPRVRDMLRLGPLADPAEFDAIYRAIDQDASNTIDRREFESFFLRQLTPASHGMPAAGGGVGYPYTAGPAFDGGAAADRERALALKARAAMQFMQAGAAASHARQATPASGSAAASAGLSPYDNGGWGLPAGSGSVGASGLRLSTPNQELADVNRFDELTRGLQASQQRKLGLERDLAALQSELRAVEADISLQQASGEQLKAMLLQHQAAHGSAASQIEHRLKVIDREAQLAARPHLRTAERIDVP